MCYGRMPKIFTFEYVDKDKKYHKINDLLNHGKASTVNEEEEDMNFPGVKILVVEDCHKVNSLL